MTSYDLIRHLMTSNNITASCMASPAGSACSSSSVGGAGSLPVLVASKCDASTCSLLQSCLTSPSDPGCSLASTAGSLPSLVTSLDACMTSVEAASCTASYGASSNLISAGGSGMVGWIQQLSKITSYICPNYKMTS